MISNQSLFGYLLALIFIFSCSKEIIRHDEDIAEPVSGKYYQTSTHDTILVEKLDDSTIVIRDMSLLSDFTGKLASSEDSTPLHITLQEITYDTYPATIEEFDSTDCHNYFIKSTGEFFLSLKLSWFLDIEHTLKFTYNGIKE
jgi:hypothetical protein